VKQVSSGNAEEGYANEVKMKAREEDESLASTGKGRL